MEAWIGSIWKPVGVSSFKVLGEVKKKFGTKRVGHMGTLDPLAEGVLPFAVGRYTKLIQYVNLLPKVYVAEITFGCDSETLDAEGVSEQDLDVIRGRDVNVSEGKLIQVLQGMVGKVNQVPPVFSALKVDGVRAYEIARKGGDVKMKAREVECFGLKLLSLKLKDGLMKATVRVECGKGYYVRSLVRDVCVEIGVEGFMSGLIRESVGSFSGDNCLHVGFEMEKVEDVEWEEVLDSDLNKYELTEAEVSRLRNGLEVVADLEGMVVGMYQGVPVSIVEGDGVVLRVIKNI